MVRTLTHQVVSGIVHSVELHAERHLDSVDDALAVVMVGMSAGGLVALRILVERLPNNLPAAVVIAHHAAKPSLLSELLRRWTTLRVRDARDDDRLIRGTIYTCPVEHHIVINPDASLSVVAGPRIDYVRPSIDWLFESGAATFGDRAIAVVLSGSNRDGARGALIVGRASGSVIVQAPRASSYRQMPLATVAAYPAAGVAEPAKLADAIVSRLEQLDLARAHDEWVRPFAATV